jgi:feoA domain
MNLREAPEHQPLTIANLQPGSADEERDLRHLGLRSGATIEVLRRTTGGGRIIAVEGGRVAMGRDLLEQVTVS